MFWMNYRVFSVFVKRRAGRAIEDNRDILPLVAVLNSTRHWCHPMCARLSAWKQLCRGCICAASPRVTMQAAAPRPAMRLKAYRRPWGSRLKAQWAEDYQAWNRRDLAQERYVYVWADGSYSTLRGEDDRLRLLVLIGVNEQGEKRLLSLSDGYRESKTSWRTVRIPS